MKEKTTPEVKKRTVKDDERARELYEIFKNAYAPEYQGNLGTLKGKKTKKTSKGT